MRMRRMVAFVGFVGQGYAGMGVKSVKHIIITLCIVWHVGIQSSSLLCDVHRWDIVQAADGDWDMVVTATQVRHQSLTLFFVGVYSASCAGDWDKGPPRPPALMQSSPVSPPLLSPPPLRMSRPATSCSSAMGRGATMTFSCTMVRGRAVGLSAEPLSMHQADGSHPDINSFHPTGMLFASVP